MPEGSVGRRFTSWYSVGGSVVRGQIRERGHDQVISSSSSSSAFFFATAVPAHHRRLEPALTSVWQRDHA